MTTGTTDEPSRLENIVSRLGELATRWHLVSEDPWYNCPLSSEGTANEFKPADVCDCGASEHNAKVKALLDEYNELKANAEFSGRSEA